PRTCHGREGNEAPGRHRPDPLPQGRQGNQVGRRGEEGGTVERMDYGRVPRPDADDEEAGGGGGQDLRPARRGGAATAERAIQGLAADGGAHRSADLSPLRARERL